MDSIKSTQLDSASRAVTKVSDRAELAYDSAKRQLAKLDSLLSAKDLEKKASLKLDSVMQIFSRLSQGGKKGVYDSVSSIDPTRMLNGKVNSVQQRLDSVMR